MPGLVGVFFFLVFALYTSTCTLAKKQREGRGILVGLLIYRKTVNLWMLDPDEYSTTLLEPLSVNRRHVLLHLRDIRSLVDMCFGILPDILKRLIIALIKQIGEP